MFGRDEKEEAGEKDVVWREKVDDVSSLPQSGEGRASLVT